MGHFVELMVDGFGSRGGVDGAWGLDVGKKIVYFRLF